VSWTGSREISVLFLWEKLEEESHLKGLEKDGMKSLIYALNIRMEK
jgi:hypothetical protein